jgi:hypothetical protein
MHYLIWDARRVAVAFHKGVNEMGGIMINITLNLYHGELEEVEEVEHLKAALTGVKVVFRERGHIFREAGPSTSAPGSSIICGDFDVDLFTSAIDLSLIWTSWSGADLSISVTSLSVSWENF